MKIVRIQDAEITGTSKWSWDNQCLLIMHLKHPFTAFRCTSRRTQIILNQLIIKEHSGWLSPEDLWPELTSILFEHDIICEPIELELTPIALPEMESP